MTPWTTALKPHYDAETGETIQFYPCPRLPTQLIFKILEDRTQSVREDHKKQLSKCFIEMNQKYRGDLHWWGDGDEEGEYNHYKKVENVWVYDRDEVKKQIADELDWGCWYCAVLPASDRLIPYTPDDPNADEIEAEETLGLRQPPFESLPKQMQHYFRPWYIY